MNAKLLGSLALTAAVSGVLMSSSAMAQPSEASTASSAEQDKDKTTEIQEIVVTGTLIRDAEPVGSDVIAISSGAIEAVGGNTTNQILNSLPQIGNFFNSLPVGVPGASIANASNPISRPNLRNLPGANTSGGAQTLVLIDNHRVVGAGTQQVAVDPDLIAPGVIERVEALTDGGSAIYGSDALGGVLNFITRKRFDGVQATARYAIGDSYDSMEGGLMAGKDWGSGSAYVAYGYTKQDDVFGSDRAFVKRIDWTTGVPVGRNCADPNISIGTGSYVVSGAGLAAGGPNVCDPSDDVAIYPESTLNNVFGSLTQEITDSVSLEVTSFYAKRETDGNEGTLGVAGATTGTVTIPSTNPFYRDSGDANSGRPQTVRFNYGPVAGFRSSERRTEFETYGITPSLSVDLPKDWKLRTLASYGHSSVTYRNNLLDPTLQGAAVAAGTLNPYDVAATSPAVLAGILGGIEQGAGKNELYDYRAIVDGPVFAAPGGEVRLALGAEYMRGDFKRRQTDGRLVLSPYFDYEQTVKSAFGEVQVPIVGDSNALSFVRQLSLSASGRYDEYNDFGDTTNPKLGLTYKPIESITLRGSWGKSFNAPSPSDQLGPQTAAASIAPGQFLSPPPSVPGVCGGALPACTLAGTAGVFLGGGSIGDLQPQRAESWSAGIEFQPPAIEGLEVSLSYYHIDLNGTLGRPVTGTSLAPFYLNFPNLSIYRPTGQQLAAVLAGLQNQANVGFTLVNPTSTSQAIVRSGGVDQPVGVLLDTLVRNLGTTELSGIDFAAHYVLDTGFGSVDAGFAGNYRLKQDTQISPTAPMVEELDVENSKFVSSTTLGANIGNFRAQATWNHTSGYKRGDAGAASAFGQERVKAFDIVNLYFNYSFDGEGLERDLSLSAYLNNVFDEDPPQYRNSGQPGYDPSHTFTLGRTFQVGVNKKF